MTSPIVSRAALEEVIALAAGHLQISRGELLEALGPRVLDQMIAAAAAGVASGSLSIVAAEEAIALMVSYLNPPPRRFSRSTPHGQPAPRTSAEVLTALESLAAEQGTALAALILFLRETAEMRIADALTVLRLLDQIEVSVRER